jgi:hypothetical protein
VRCLLSRKKVLKNYFQNPSHLIQPSKNIFKKLTSNRFIRSKIPIKVIEINCREKQCDEGKNIRYESDEWSIVNGQ